MLKKVLEIVNVSKSYKNRIAVKNLSFDIFEGEIFGFLGANGAGKSTTIKMITGLASITSGDIFICGKSIVKDFEKAISNVGAIIETPEMFGYMSGYENLKYFADISKEKVTKERIFKVAKLVGMENRLKDKFRSYSMGMKQRLGIAQALLSRPKLLILDEPTNGLDANGIKEVRQFLKQISRQEKIAILISSHILAEMEQLCDTIGIIDKGSLIELKSMEQIKTGYGGQTQSIKVDYPNYAAKLLYKKFQLNAEVAGPNILVQCDEKLVPEILTLLISNKLSVFNVQTISKSLEDVFMDIIRSKSKNKSTSIK